MTDTSRQIVEAVAIAAQGLNVTPLDVAMTWVRQSSGVTSAITGGRTAAQLRAILNSADMELPAEIIQALNDVSKPTFLYPGANLQSQ
jgi:aryl-alcohol dehydrogenase-like predicted oxidoreductase